MSTSPIELLILSFGLGLGFGIAMAPVFLIVAYYFVKSSNAHTEELKE